MKKLSLRFKLYALVITLLLGWLPLGGDALTLVGGIMRVPWLNFVILVAIGKGLRYGLVIWLVLEASGVPGSP